jgi:hypothetical protein
MWSGEAMSIDVARLRRRMVQLATSEYSASPQETGEPPEGNGGEAATKYLNGGQRPGTIKYVGLAFCVGFYEWLLKQCLAEQGAPLPWHYTLQASKLWQFFIDNESAHAADEVRACQGVTLDDERAGDAPQVVGSCIYLPQPGDAVFTYRKAPDKPGHVYMVKEVKGDRLIGLGANEHLFKAPSVPALRLTDRGPLTAIPRLVGYGDLSFLGATP